MARQLYINGGLSSHEVNGMITITHPLLAAVTSAGADNPKIFFNYANSLGKGIVKYELLDKDGQVVASSSASAKSTSAAGFALFLDDSTPAGAGTPFQDRIVWNLDEIQFSTGQMRMTIAGALPAGSSPELVCGVDHPILPREQVYHGDVDGNGRAIVTLNFSVSAI